MTAQALPVPAMAKQPWLDSVRLEVANRAQLTGLTHIGEVHKLIIDGVIPPPANARWMSAVFRQPYFTRVGTMTFPDKKVYANSKIVNSYKYDHFIFMSKFSQGKVSKRLARLLSDARAW